MLLIRLMICGGVVAGLLSLAGCSGGGPSSPPPAPVQGPPLPSLPPVSAPLDFSAVKQRLDVFEVDDFAVLVGDEDGVLFEYERGSVSADSELFIASASKMLVGLVIWDLIEGGNLSQDSAPQDYIDFWTVVELGGRSGLSLDQLMGLVSGFNNSPQQPGCIGEVSFTLPDCVKDIHDGGLDTMPGEAFYYGPEHHQIAALMASRAVGLSFDEILQANLVTPFGLSDRTYFPTALGDNPRYAGSARSTAADYGLLLAAVLGGRLVHDRAGYLEDRTADVFFGFRPNAAERSDTSWHYGFGFWIECDALSFRESCNETPVISSPGGFGFTPWIDFEHGYWGVIALQEQSSPGLSVTERSVDLEQDLQPLIERALDSQ